MIELERIRVIDKSSNDYPTMYIVNKSNKKIIFKEQMTYPKKGIKTNFACFEEGLHNGLHLSGVNFLYGDSVMSLEEFNECNYKE